MLKVFVSHDNHRHVTFGDNVMKVQSSSPCVERHRYSPCSVSAVHGRKEFDLIVHEQAHMAARKSVPDQCLSDPAGHFVSLGEGYL